MHFTENWRDFDVIHILIAVSAVMGVFVNIIGVYSNAYNVACELTCSEPNTPLYTCKMNIYIDTYNMYIPTYIRAYTHSNLHIHIHTYKST